MKWFFSIKKSLAVILSVCLIITSFPQNSLSQSFLVPPSIDEIQKQLDILDITNDPSSKHELNYDRIRNQVIKIEMALGKDGMVENQKADEIINAVKASNGKLFKKEEVHILNGVGQSAKIIGRLDRKIAENYGYIHETANIILLTPCGQVLLQMRNKSNYDDHLGMYGGHLGVGESHFSAAIEELKQELDLDKLYTDPVFVGYQEYDYEGDPNKERRSWFVKVLTPREYAEIQKKQEDANKLKASRCRTDYKKHLFEIQKEGTGKGEVVNIYEVDFDVIKNAARKVWNAEKKSIFFGKQVRFLNVDDEFNGKIESVDAFFSPDSLDTLFSMENTELLNRISYYIYNTRLKISSKADLADHHLSEDEMKLLEVAKHRSGEANIKGTPESRTEIQIMQIEKALDHDEETARKQVDLIMNDIEKGGTQLRGEDEHILNGVGRNATVIGLLDRNVAEKFGYVHETANIVIVSPGGEVLLQLRNKKKYDDHLAMYGGHLMPGESHLSGAVRKLTRELQLDQLDSLPIFVGYESYDYPDDPNKERRSWFVKVLTQYEYSKIQDREEQEKKIKSKKSRPEYKRSLLEKRQQEGDVVGTYKFSFEDISTAEYGENPKSPYADKKNRFLVVKDSFNGKVKRVVAYFTPDSLDRLLAGENASLWYRIKEMSKKILTDWNERKEGLSVQNWKSYVEQARTTAEEQLQKEHHKLIKDEIVVQIAKWLTRGWGVKVFFVSKSDPASTPVNPLRDHIEAYPLLTKDNIDDDEMIGAKNNVLEPFINRLKELHHNLKLIMEGSRKEPHEALHKIGIELKAMAIQLDDLIGSGEIDHERASAIKQEISKFYMDSYLFRKVSPVFDIISKGESAATVPYKDLVKYNPIPGIVFSVNSIHDLKYLAHGICTGYAMNFKRKEQQFHSHPYEERTISLSENTVLVYKDEYGKDQEVSVRYGELLQIPPGTVHKIINRSANIFNADVTFKGPFLHLVKSIDDGASMTDRKISVRKSNEIRHDSGVTEYLQALYGPLDLEAWVDHDKIIYNEAGLPITEGKIYLNVRHVKIPPQGKTPSYKFSPLYQNVQTIILYPWSEKTETLEEAPINGELIKWIEDQGKEISLELVAVFEDGSEKVVAANGGDFIVLNGANKAIKEYFIRNLSDDRTATVMMPEKEEIVVEERAVGVYSVGALSMSFFNNLSADWIIGRKKSDTTNMLMQNNKISIDGRDRYVSNNLLKGLVHNQQGNTNILPEVIIVCPYADQIDGFIDELIEYFYLIEDTEEYSIDNIPKFIFASSGIYFEELIEKIKQKITDSRLKNKTFFDNTLERRMFRGVAYLSGVREGIGAEANYITGKEKARLVISRNGEEKDRARIEEVINGRESNIKLEIEEKYLESEFTKGLVNLVFSAFTQLYSVVSPDQELCKVRFGDLFSDSKYLSEQFKAQQLRDDPVQIRKKAETVGQAFINVAIANGVYPPGTKYSNMFRQIEKYILENVSGHIPSSLQLFFQSLNAPQLIWRGDTLLPTESFIIDSMIDYARKLEKEKERQILESFKKELIANQKIAIKITEREKGKRVDFSRTDKFIADLIRNKLTEADAPPYVYEFLDEEQLIKAQILYEKYGDFDVWYYPVDVLGDPMANWDTNDLSVEVKSENKIEYQQWSHNLNVLIQERISRRKEGRQKEVSGSNVMFDLMGKKEVAIKANDATIFIFKLVELNDQTYSIEAWKGEERVGYFDFKLGEAQFGYNRDSVDSAAIEVSDRQYKGIGRAMVSLALELSKEKGKSEFIIKSSTTNSFWLGLGFGLKGKELLSFDLENSEIPNISIVTKYTVRKIPHAILFESNISYDEKAKIKEANDVAKKTLGAMVLRVKDGLSEIIRVVSANSGLILFEDSVFFAGNSAELIHDNTRKVSELRKKAKALKRQNPNAIIIERTTEYKTFSTGADTDLFFKIMVIEEDKKGESFPHATQRLKPFSSAASHQDLLISR